MTRRKQHIGSHSKHAHPDEQMRPRADEIMSSAQRRVEQSVSNKKRRQRDRRV